MTPVLLLIDALNLIRRIHAVIPAGDGSPEAEAKQVDDALTATLTSLQRAIHDCQPSHVLVVFDGDPPTWRHELYPAYKAGRKPMPAPLRQRLREFNQRFREFGVMTFRRNGMEADDVIGAVTHKAVAGGVKTVILSTDKAYRQLLHWPLVTQRDHFRKVDFNGDAVHEEFGVSSEQLLDYWAMAGIGDVPGVDGVGPKGATALLNEYTTLDAILAVGDEEGDSGRVKKGPLKKVLAQSDQALLSRQMATLKRDIELGMSLKDLRFIASSPR